MTGLSIWLLSAWSLSFGAGNSFHPLPDIVASKKVHLDQVMALHDGPGTEFPLEVTLFLPHSNIAGKRFRGLLTDIRQETEALFRVTSLTGNLEGVTKDGTQVVLGTVAGYEVNDFGESPVFRIHWNRRVTPTLGVDVAEEEVIYFLDVRRIQNPSCNHIIAFPDDI